MTLLDVDFENAMHDRDITTGEFKNDHLTDLDGAASEGEEQKISTIKGRFHTTTINCVKICALRVRT